MTAMKDRRMARRCRNCGESMPAGALLCAACGKAGSEIFTRLTDPADMRLPRFQPKRVKR
jgi:predicted RNA-binding protein with PUA domain